MGFQQAVSNLADDVLAREISKRGQINRSKRTFHGDQTDLLFIEQLRNSSADTFLRLKIGVDILEVQHVIPAKAGIQMMERLLSIGWIPAFAGMTATLFPHTSLLLVSKDRMGAHKRETQ